VQLFDSWGGILAPDHFKKWSLDWLFKVVSDMRRDDAPVIVFSRGANHSLSDLADIGADVVGIDWTIDIAEVRDLIGDRVAIQGNLDPAVLFATPGTIRSEVRSILGKFGGAPGHVFNLGHGISPTVPVSHVQALVEAVKEESILHVRSR
jgi:uroporphyrinogen decarboxylase